MISFEIITIFPQIFDSYFNESIITRALKKKLIKINVHDLRKWAKGRHRQVDDRPYGGGPGMILMVEPIAKALRKLKAKSLKLKARTIMLTPAGKRFTQREAERLAKYGRLILLCGRYEGFDARVDKLVDEKISIGDYVLAGGEIPAMVVLEAVARQAPGVVGHEHALDEETFSKDLDYVEYPQYTRPESIKLKAKSSKLKAYKVPKVLLSGDHKKIKEWRGKNAKLIR
ncbi:MAG: tRNA (guanosine(37)-N1)-methyltransferase TrmD [Candidatus Buchananbacteria bacterium RIFCSPLOWO2_01_FULL_45_31]|uniref:tRNA (guanine-N(1)-)-methyltransferase n=1 Tax=Candidatus Buchananbacteria bacterium RIFCSPLOWO2_01_FULL_45_31 TaxID=1797545 RepID=A0A1G1YNL1_9BACT|nr:MAG: tRNA (guanosine(37)-N1)-methyltransferase TrmD [Candidatus Buchananbacteria bacterium RIFCSPLOWO2_01_FULL_45_31]